MTLLITLFAAVIATALWYKNAPTNDMRIGILVTMYWGAALMWLVDAIFEYVELGAEYFTPPAADMINDAYLGFAVVALGLVVWVIALIVRDPKGVMQEVLSKQK